MPLTIGKMPRLMLRQAFCPRQACLASTRMFHMLSPLPHNPDDLRPLASARAIKRHRKFEQHLIDGLNKLLEGSDLEHTPLDELIAVSGQEAQEIQCFEHAAEAWSHSFYWARVTPGGAEAPSELLRWIQRDFGSYDGLVTQFVSQARGLWGSGWTWLVMDRNSLRLHVVNSTGRSHPLALGLKPLLGIDMWEHAYMFEHGLDREAYVRAYLSLADWALVCDDLLAAVNLADEHTKLKYLVRLSMDDMKRLEHTMVHHGTLDLPDLPSLHKLGLLHDGLERGPKSAIDAAIIDVAGIGR